MMKVNDERGVRILTTGLFQLWCVSCGMMTVMVKSSSIPVITLRNFENFLKN
jgi:hypothetical protein